MLVCRANHDVEGEPAALYHVALDDGPLAGDEEDLEEWELLQSLPLPGTTEFAPVPSSTESVPVGATPFQAGNESCGREDAAAGLSFPSPMSPRSLTRHFSGLIVSFSNVSSVTHTSFQGGEPRARYLQHDGVATRRLGGVGELGARGSREASA